MPDMTLMNHTGCRQKAGNGQGNVRRNCVTEHQAPSNYSRGSGHKYQALVFVTSKLSYFLLHQEHRDGSKPKQL